MKHDVALSSNRISIIKVNKYRIHDNCKSDVILTPRVNTAFPVPLAFPEPKVTG